MMDVKVAFPPPLDPAFIPAYAWNAAYLEGVRHSGLARTVRIALVRGPEDVSVYTTEMFPPEAAYGILNWRYLERLVKFLLWQRGAPVILIDGAPELVSRLRTLYAAAGDRQFDAALLGTEVFGKLLNFQAQEQRKEPFPEATDASQALGNHFDGCRIGFDLGGSDRKCAAMIDGEVVFSEEIPWDPYFQSDPDYHRNGIREIIMLAAEKLPRVDAIGGSAAGIYMNNEVRVASLFRGIPKDRFATEVAPIFKQIAIELGNPPMVVCNDGEVTALAGSYQLKSGALLGISMGTSQAAGYVTPEGKVTPMLNELAFAPVDFRADAPEDEWSGDCGCGVQYFSQQAVARLMDPAGIEADPDLPDPEKLIMVQKLMSANDKRARAIYETIGTYLAYSLAHYADFYQFRNVMLLGRVLSGGGGEVIIQTCRRVLGQAVPHLAQHLKLIIPDETQKRHGQAIAAASLPAIP